MTDLITKLEEAGEGSRELDVDVTLALGLWTPPARSERTSADVWKRDSVNHYCQHTPATQSLDAALALAERVLPGWDWQIVKGADEPAYVAIQPRDAAFGHEAQASTPALALCAAILRAFEEKQS